MNIINAPCGHKVVSHEVDARDGEAMLIHYEPVKTRNGLDLSHMTVSGVTLRDGTVMCGSCYSTKRKEMEGKINA